MSALGGSRLLHAVAERVIARYLEHSGLTDVRANDESALGARADKVDITYTTSSGPRGIKVKSDPYIGPDPAKTADRSRSFYRPDDKVYAFETIATTRAPGWVFSSAADDLFYYYLAIDQPEAEVGLLFAEADDVFFSSLRVAADDLHILPFADLRAWFEPRQGSYPTRPVVRDGGAAWYRLVPQADVATGVRGLQRIGAVFASLSR